MSGTNLAQTNFKKATGDEVKAQVDAFLIKNGGSGGSRETDLFFLAALEGEIIGSVRFCVEENAPMLRTMMIDEAARNHGVGSKLLQMFQHYLNANSIRETYCLPYSHLLDFYAQIGFAPVAETELPAFLRERLVDYRHRNPHKSYAAMKRP